MKKASDKDMLPEYDFSGGTRGRYVSRLSKGSNVVVLDDDMRKLFPDSASVNSALRAFADVVRVTREASPAARSSRRVAKKRAAA